MQTLFIITLAHTIY